MNDVVDHYAIDQSLVEDGVWLDFGGGRRWKCRYAGESNLKYGEALKHAYRPFIRLAQRGTLPLAKEREIAAGVYSKVIVITFEGERDPDDAKKTLDFSRENVLKVLTKRPEFFSDLRAECERLANYRAEEVEAAVKN